jgi:hypothetical protein
MWAIRSCISQNGSFRLFFELENITFLNTIVSAFSTKSVLKIGIFLEYTYFQFQLIVCKYRFFIHFPRIPGHIRIILTSYEKNILAKYYCYIASWYRPAKRQRTFKNFRKNSKGYVTKIIADLNLEVIFVVASSTFDHLLSHSTAPLMNLLFSVALSWNTRKVRG